MPAAASAGAPATAFPAAGSSVRLSEVSLLVCHFLAAHYPRVLPLFRLEAKKELAQVATTQGAKPRQLLAIIQEYTQLKQQQGMDGERNDTAEPHIALVCGALIRTVLLCCGTCSQLYAQSSCTCLVACLQQILSPLPLLHPLTLARLLLLRAARHQPPLLLLLSSRPRWWTPCHASASCWRTTRCCAMKSLRQAWCRRRP